jgi:hypothetical protein
MLTFQSHKTASALKTKMFGNASMNELANKICLFMDLLHPPPFFNFRALLFQQPTHFSTENANVQAAQKSIPNITNCNYSMYRTCSIPV